MKKLHSVAFYALITPIISLGAGSVLAQQPSSDHDEDNEQQSTQRDQDADRSTLRTTQGEQSSQRDRQSESQAAVGGQTGDRSRMEHTGYMASVPANGMHSSDLIGADVLTTGDEVLGSVSELIIDENGQIVAIIVGVGGFLGLGEKAVAIGWDDVTKSGDSDELELQIDATREALRSAPEFEMDD